jgi:hypothetical protein
MLSISAGQQKILETLHEMVIKLASEVRNFRSMRSHQDLWPGGAAGGDGERRAAQNADRVDAPVVWLRSQLDPVA